MKELLLSSIVGALLSIDRTAFLQMMVSQPIVAGAVTGLALGDPLTGLLIGSILELMWLSSVPVGSHVPPHETIAVVIAVSVCIWAGNTMGYTGNERTALMVFSVMISIPLAILGQKVDIEVRKRNSTFAVNADKLLEEGRLCRISVENMKGLFSFFTATLLSIIVLEGVGFVFTRAIFPLLPEWTIRGLLMSFGVLLALGVAVIIRSTGGRRIVPLFAAGFVAGFLLFRW